jgi:preprotein translocase subunit SecB
MSTAESVDMSAVGRVARRVDLQSIRLTGLSVEAPVTASRGAALEPHFSRACKAMPLEKGMLEVACAYDFKIRSGDEQVAVINATYKLIYQLSGDEPVAESDAAQFANANGAYHSWPFLRELLFGLTARMGYPPFTLPVLLFAQPKPAAKKAEPALKQAEPAPKDSSGNDPNG